MSLGVTGVQDLNPGARAGVWGLRWDPCKGGHTWVVKGIGQYRKN